jgi:hypothetical protein
MRPFLEKQFADMDLLAEDEHCFLDQAAWPASPFNCSD